MSTSQHVSREAFSREVWQSPTPVVIDFFADWCPPCRALTPRLERLEAEFSGQVKIVKINIDEEPELASQFHVDSIPTLVFVAGGEVVGRAVGLVSEVRLRQALHQLKQVAGPASRGSSV